MAKYSKDAGAKVAEALHEMKEGKLTSGTGKKVTSRRQAIAIGLAEARDAGAKVPAPEQTTGNQKAATKSSAGNKAPAKKAGTKRAAPKKAVVGKAAAKKSAPKKAAGKATARKSATATKAKAPAKTNTAKKSGSSRRG